MPITQRAKALTEKSGGFLAEFKKFALRGNVMDLAVGLMLGASFNGIVQSLVNDVVMPPIGLLLGRVDFSSLFVDLSGGEYESLAQAKEAGAATINYGVFLNAVINFLIVAFVVFLIVRQVNRLRAKEEPKAAPATKECPFCLTQIPPKATRCPACTSQMPEAEKKA